MPKTHSVTPGCWVQIHPNAAVMNIPRFKGPLRPVQIRIDRWPEGYLITFSPRGPDNYTTTLCRTYEQARRKALSLYRAYVKKELVHANKVAAQLQAELLYTLERINEEHTPKS